MKFGSRLLGVATAASFAATLALPAAAQSANPNVPANMPVPNSGTHVQCNANGTGTVSQQPNATVPTTQTAPGTPVTQTNPNGTGTTTSQTPTLQKPTSGVTPQCPATTTPATTTTMPMAPPATAPMGNGPNGTQMDALNSNPNGSNWLDKFNRPNVAASNAHRHHTKRATGGGGQY